MTGPDHSPDRYLTLFGGLDAGLPALDADPLLAGVDDLAPLRTLAVGLAAAGRHRDLRRLLLTGTLVNVWFEAHEAHDDVEGFLADVDLARRHAAAETDAALADGGQARSLVDEVWLGLVAASVHSRRDRASTEVAARLRAAGIGTVDRLARHETPRRVDYWLKQGRASGGRYQVRIVVHLLPDVPSGDRPALIADTLEHTLAFRLPVPDPDRLWDDENYWRGAAIADLAPHLGPGQASAALNALATVENPYFYEALAWAALVPVLPPDRRDEVIARALSVAATIFSAGHRGEALAAVAPHLDAAQLRRAVEAAADFDWLYQADALTPLVPHLPAEHLAGVLAFAVGHPFETPRAALLAALAPRLPDRLLPHAFAAAKALTYPEPRAEALTALVPHLPETVRAAAVRRALDAAATSPGWQRVRTLAGLAAHLPDRLTDRALDIAAAIADEQERAAALAGLAPHLPARHVDAALAAATAIHDEVHRAHGLEALVAHLPADRAAQGLATVPTLHSPALRARVWTALAPRLPAGMRAVILRRAVAAATAVGDHDWRARALTALAPTALRRATGAPDRDPGARGQEHGGSGRDDVTADGVLDAVRGIVSASARAQALVGVTPHLPPDRLGDVLDIAATITDPRVRAEALAGLAPHLPAQQCRDAVAVAALAADRGARGQALAGLTPYLPEDDRATALDLTLDIAEAEPKHRARILVALGHATAAGTLPPHVADRALRLAAAVVNHYQRADALAALAPHSRDAQPGPPAAAAGTPTEQADLLDRAVDSALLIDDEHSRARELGRLAPRLPAHRRDHVLRAATGMSGAYPRALALTWLAPHLPAPARDAAVAGALAAAAEVDDLKLRVSALSRLLPVLPEHQRVETGAQALDAAEAIATEPDTVRARAGQPGQARANAVAEIAPHLPAALLPRAATVAAGTAGDPHSDHAAHTMLAVAHRARQCLDAQPGAATARTAVLVLRTGLDAQDRRIGLAAITGLAGAIETLAGTSPAAAVLGTAAWWA
ncbi:hypothetical protein ACQEVZ_47790 [Dactylosporangium sp. CA-152071]|uniref:hypothetical protein n=1 Tax=Dactylosporangium sp. CA-152071 TaxID=3239933 RepID=UPI003D8D7ADF